MPVVTSNAVLPEHNLTEIAIFSNLQDAKEIYKLAYKLNEKDMLKLRKVLYLVILLIFFILPGSGASDVLLDGTIVHLVTGDSYGLYQGYLLTLKSVSSDGSVWLQLTEDDKLVKSEIIGNSGYFVFNKSNRTIISVKVEAVYSGSQEQNLVSLFPVYQYLDTDKPAPAVTGAPPENMPVPGNNNSIIRIHTPAEPVIWALGIVFTLIMFYILRRLW